jgi:hypothetical protein
MCPRSKIYMFPPYLILIYDVCMVTQVSIRAFTTYAHMQHTHVGRVSRPRPPRDDRGSLIVELKNVEVYTKRYPSCMARVTYVCVVFSYG